MKNTNHNLTNKEGVNKNSKLKAILLPFGTFFVLFISQEVIYNSNLMFTPLIIAFCNSLGPYTDK